MLSLSFAFSLVWASFTSFEASFSWCNGHFLLRLVVEQIVSSRIRPDPSSMCTTDLVIGRVAVRGEGDGMDVEDFALDVLGAFGAAASPAETVELQLPQPSFNLRNILYRIRGLPAPMSEPGSSTVPVDDIEAQTEGGTASAQDYAEDNTNRSG